MTFDEKLAALDADIAEAQHVLRRAEEAADDAQYAVNELWRKRFDLMNESPELLAIAKRLGIEP